MNQIFSIFCVLIVSEYARAYHTGAPVEVCQSMVPEHGVPPQKGSSPYTLTANKGKVTKGDKVTVKIISTATSGPFKGFFLQARNSANESVGTFQKVSGTSVIDCPPGKQNAITHASPDDKTVITTNWTPPPQSRGEITFVLTVAKNGETFWVGQRSRKVSYE